MSQQTNDKRRYEIDLDRSRAPRAYRDRQNLWREDIQRIHRLIERQVESLTDWERDQESRRDRERRQRQDDRPHLSVAIFGPSGSGKSSLIRTLADDVRREHGQILPERLEKKVATLPVMDPTTWARTDQFLYAFLAAALEEERHEQERKEHGYPQGLSPVQLAFQEVNEYLRVVDEPERSEEHDPLGLSLQKLERHTSGLRLREALGKLIEELAKEFRSEVVLLPIDDLDMAPDHLVDALQSYQSYLTHPRLIPVFTFTDRMPEELIEVYYQRSMSDAASHRRLGGINRLSISEQMAVQFLARCFPVRNRIRLGPAPARVQRALYSSRSIRTGKNQKPEKAQVSELLIQSSFLLFGYPDGEDSHKIRAALRPSTLRRQFQVVDAMSDCRLWTLRTPQFATMAELDHKDIAQLAKSRSLDLTIRGEKFWKDDWPQNCKRLGQVWPDLNRLLTTQKALEKGRYTPDTDYTKGQRLDDGFLLLAFRLSELRIGATWATVFNGAAWSLLNVHRDTLRELGLFLEDLYSWSPKELRSVVLENILAQDQVTRRTVVDRWFNRTDYRRSQVLSLLAANIFRPWLPGEEPHGDEEIPLRKQLKIEQEIEQGEKFEYPIDRDWEMNNAEQTAKQIRERLTIPAPKGLLWFLHVTLGFYLPQIMARNWGEALARDAPVKSRMSGNGWDLHHAATNAMRIADTKQEIFSFGMLFLDPAAYRRSLQVVHKREALALEVSSDNPDEARIEKLGKWLGSCSEEYNEGCKKKYWRNHLLLRTWSCCGYSSGRYWAAFSFWRGLGFIGQVLEVGLQNRDFFEPEDSEDTNTLSKARKKLEDDLFRLIRTHGLKGLVPGSLLNLNSDDERLLHGFPRWQPRGGALEKAITDLGNDLIKWLSACWSDLIYPLPAGDLWIGWGDCFIRRIHGEYVLGGLWPRLNAAYLEEYERIGDWSVLGENRRTIDPDNWRTWKGPDRQNLGENEQYRWSASLAAGAWSDLILEYWRGCPPILKLLLTCPVMFKSRHRFENLEALNQLLEKNENETTSTKKNGAEENRPEEIENTKEMAWLRHLGLPNPIWEDVMAFWKGDGESPSPTLVPSELAIPRVHVKQFTAPGERHHAIRLESAEFRVTGEERSDPRGTSSFTAPLNPEESEDNKG